MAEQKEPTIKMWLGYAEAANNFHQSGVLTAIQDLPRVLLDDTTQWFPLDVFTKRLIAPESRVIILDAYRIHQRASILEALLAQNTLQHVGERMIDMKFGKFKDVAPIDIVDLYVFDPSYYGWMWNSGVFEKSGYSVLNDKFMAVLAQELFYPLPILGRKFATTLFCWEEMDPLCQVLIDASLFTAVDATGIPKIRRSPLFTLVDLYKDMENAKFEMDQGKYAGLTLAFIHAEHPSYLVHIANSAKTNQQLREEVMAFLEDVDKNFPAMRRKRKVEDVSPAIAVGGQEGLLDV